MTDLSGSAPAPSRAPEHAPENNVIGLGMAAPTLLRFGTAEQIDRWVPPIRAGAELWCQLFSEPGAGSDLAGLATSAVRAGDAPDADWVVNGQKVWTTLAHQARWALLVARTDPTAPKHRGLTYFVLDMRAPGIEIRPLRQITGETEFNEVFLTDVRVPDAHRIGGVGEGWAVTQGTLMNERVQYTSAPAPRGSGPIGCAVDAWSAHPDRRTPALHGRLLELWVDAEVARLAAARLGQQIAAGQPGPEGSAAKLEYARLNQAISSLELDLLGADGLRYTDYTERLPVMEPEENKEPGWRYLRSRANSIEGGTSEILRNIIAERVLGLPVEPRADKNTAWQDLPR